MKCIVTAGPTFETMDNVRRLTNLSTGRLGTELATFLSGHGHDVTLLIGQQATFRGEARARFMEIFTTSGDLRDRLEALSGNSVSAVFHAAAVSDFMFGKIWLRSPSGDLSEIKSGKISTRQGTLLAELVPTPKIISLLRGWFPQARIVGWKFEVDGNREGVLTAAKKQIGECLTDASVANGPAYGAGFGLVTASEKYTHAHDTAELYDALEQFIHA